MSEGMVLGLVLLKQLSVYMDYQTALLSERNMSMFCMVLHW